MPIKACILPDLSSLAPRFWAKVEKRRSADCWVWCGSLLANGYGQVHYRAKGGRWTTTVAHRVAYRLVVGPICAGLCVCHRCDNRRCVNPRHLFLGTAKENTADMHQKGRHDTKTRRRGEACPQAKLTRAKVRAIRASKLGDTDAARKFAVSRSAIWKVRTGKTWKQI